MSTELAIQGDPVYSTASLGERKEYARALAAAGSLLPKGLMERNERGMDVPSPGKILLIAETGNMLSIHPVAAIQGINVIEGQPTLSPALMSALVRRAGHKLRVRQEGVLEDNTFRVTVEIIRRDDPDFTYRAVWTMDRAARAGLVKWEQKDGRWKATARSQKGNPLPWESYSEAMLTSRAIGECSRMAAEDVLLGIHYTPEELGAVVNEAGEATGDMIDGEIIDEPQTVTPAPQVKRQNKPVQTGRVTPPNLPPQGETMEEATARAVNDFVEWIAAQDDIEQLRDLHGTASAEGLLQHPTRDGRRLNDVFYQRREAILQAQADELPPPLDGIEDDA